MLRWDRSLLGKEFSRFQRARDARHAGASMLTSLAPGIRSTPMYTPAQARGYRDMIAPPTFVAWRGAHPIAPPEMDFHGAGINAGYACVFHGVVYPGDVLTYSTCLVDMYEKTGRSGTMHFVVRETTVTNQHGNTVAVLRNPFILGW